MTSMQSIWPTGADTAYLRQLTDAVRRMDRRAVVVEPHVIGRIIRLDRGIMGVFTRIPHDHCYWISRAALMELADAQELGLDGEQSASDTVILLSCPQGDDGLPLPQEQALRALQRQLFHIKVHMAVEQCISEGLLTPAIIRQRIHQIGQTECNEIRFVLLREHTVLPPQDMPTLYAEFAATYLELRHFANHLLPRYFPTIWDAQDVDTILALDVDCDELLKQCVIVNRESQAANHDSNPTDETSSGSEHSDFGLDSSFELRPSELNGKVHPSRSNAPALPTLLSPWRRKRLLARADRAARVGNMVRAAILQTRAAQGSPGDSAAGLHQQAKATLELLADPMGKVLDLTPEQCRKLQTLLHALLAPASRGYWPREARLLYELQKACVEHQRELFSVDVVPWLLSLCRQKLIKPLPVKREVLVVRHLRSAIEKLSGSTLADTDRRELLSLLGPAIRKCENRLREYMRGILSTALANTRLEPTSVPEAVALDKSVEELLDRIMDRGILTMGDLRDAFSRNSMKLPDLGGPLPPPSRRGAGAFLHTWSLWLFAAVAGFFGGGKLLQLDRRLGLAMDGTYHHGEFYLRWLHRLSQLAFGTWTGRILTRFAIVPFGGAFIIIEGVHHLAHLVCTPPEWLHAAFESPYVLAGLGLYLLAILNFPPAMAASKWFFRHVFRFLRLMLFVGPRWLMSRPVVGRILRSRPYRIFQAYVPAPLFIGLALWLILRPCGVEGRSRLIAAGLATAVSSFVLNTRNGRRFQELTAMRLAYVWQFARRNILLGTIQLIMEAFKQALELLERFLFTVDQWLLFHADGSRFSMVLKGILSVPWFIISYVLRFMVNLLIEPQINPTKHFPVVTVSHKMILPTIPSLGRFLGGTFGMNPVAANTVATTICTSIPGFFGFLVWELMGNWRLFQANRPRNLSRAAIGEHGESMVRLMRPGLHSGTLPKLYAKIRHAEAQTPLGAPSQKLRNLRRKTHHVEECLRHFIKRELLHLLSMSKAWNGMDIILGDVRLGSSRIAFELQCPPLGPRSLWLSFDEQAGWLLAGVSRSPRGADTGWLAAASPRQRQILAMALAGFYKIAGVDMVREQIEACLGSKGVAYDITENSLVAWPGTGNNPAPSRFAEQGRAVVASRGYETEVVYRFADGKRLAPHVSEGKALASRDGLEMPTLDADRLFFRNIPISWVSWLAVWEFDAADAVWPETFAQGVRILPL